MEPTVGDMRTLGGTYAQSRTHSLQNVVRLRLSSRNFTSGEDRREIKKKKKLKKQSVIFTPNFLSSYSNCYYYSIGGTLCTRIRHLIILILSSLSRCAYIVVRLFGLVPCAQRNIRDYNVTCTYLFFFIFFLNRGRVVLKVPGWGGD